MALDGLVPVAKTKVIPYGEDEGSMTVQRLALDVTNYTRNQIILLLRGTAAQQTAAQIKLGNPPDVVISDNVRNKPASTAVKRIEVGFGQRIKPAALEAVKSILLRTIGKTTQRKTGTLANPGNWTWKLIKGGRVVPLPIGSRDGIALSSADAIVLRPEGVPHATVANIRASQGRTRARDAKRAAKGARGKGKRVAPGFMAQTTAQARRHPLLAGFNVAVRMTPYTVPGEKWKRKLTATIMITLKEGRRGRRR